MQQCAMTREQYLLDHKQVSTHNVALAQRYMIGDILETRPVRVRLCMARQTRGWLGRTHRDWCTVT